MKIPYSLKRVFAHVAQSVEEFLLTSYETRLDNAKNGVFSSDPQSYESLYAENSQMPDHARVEYLEDMCDLLEKSLQRRAKKYGLSI